MDLPKKYLAACLKVLVDTSRVCYMEFMLIFGHEKYANLDNFLVAVELNDQNSKFKILRYVLFET